MEPIWRCDQWAHEAKGARGCCDRARRTACGRDRAWAKFEEEISHTAGSIHQEPSFKVSRKRVYEALADTKQFDKVIHLSDAMKSIAMGGTPTEISREVGGAFALFGGHIIGRQIDR
jgi:hypothetical protein